MNLLELYMAWLEESGAPNGLLIGSPGREHALSGHIQRMKNDKAISRKEKARELVDELVGEYDAAQLYGPA